MVMTSYGGKNVFVKNLTNSRFEAACIAKQTPTRWNDNLRKQHFKFGQAAGASSGNRLLYGSLEGYPPRDRAEPGIKKYYTQPPSDLPVNRSDYSQLRKEHKMFSLEERTSAELKKKEREIREISEDRQRYLRQKKENELAKQNEKKQDLELLKNYREPWGRPGNGAPKSTNCRTNAVQKLSDSREQVLPLGRPGGGAPMRTDSGKLKTKSNVDPEIRFQKRERGQVIDVVGPDAKFPTESPLLTNLDKLAKKTREERNVVKRDEDTIQVRDLNEYQYYDPFGKPGGGAPAKDRNGNIVAKRTFNLVTTIQEGDPQGETNKFKNRPKWDAYLKKQTLKKDGDREVNRGLQQKYNEELDEISREKNQRRQEDIVRERRESIQHADTWNSFWGKPGNGAPLNEKIRTKKVELFDPLNNKLLV